MVFQTGHGWDLGTGFFEALVRPSEIVRTSLQVTFQHKMGLPVENLGPVNEVGNGKK